jgi:hypothetical protein
MSNINRLKRIHSSMFLASNGKYVVREKRFLPWGVFLFIATEDFRISSTQFPDYIPN